MLYPPERMGQRRTLQRVSQRRSADKKTRRSSRSCGRRSGKPLVIRPLDKIFQAEIRRKSPSQAFFSQKGCLAGKKELK